MQEESDDASLSREDIDRLVPLVYQELKQQARRERRRLSINDSLNTTMLVHETYLRLVHNGEFKSRRHFLSVASVAMRRAIIDRIRAKHTAKRGSGVEEIPLEEGIDIPQEEEAIILRVNDALEALKSANPDLVAIVECYFFAGYSYEETAAALGMSLSTLRRRWTLARTWLQKELDGT